MSRVKPLRAFRAYRLADPVSVLLAELSVTPRRSAVRAWAVCWSVCEVSRPSWSTDTRRYSRPVVVLSLVRGMVLRDH